jgi:phosphoribosylformylglycinamidine synthase
MNNKTIRRIFVEKKKPFDTEAVSLLRDLTETLGIKGIDGLRVVNRYDVSGITDEEYASALHTIFSEPPMDTVYEETLPLRDDEIPIAVQYLPGQYDQRADSAAQCIQIITRKQKPPVSAARIVVLKYDNSLPQDVVNQLVNKIKQYIINPVDSREATLEKPTSLDMDFVVPPDVERVTGFTDYTDTQLESFRTGHGLAMSRQDLAFCRDYFKNEEKRDPLITEIKLLDTYWSDHCRHTTFETRINNVEFESSNFTAPIEEAYRKYIDAYKFVKPEKADDIDTSLMNIATMSMKEMKKRGLLEDLEISGEVNACSIIRDVEVNGKNEEWLVMFKNETHNHPTEIEPFGGAATCLGGAIRDPLSGRAYVYQAMRVTGSGNPLQNIEDTLPGKLPQRKITTEAAHGYSSYGNQIGVATGKVAEIYHDGYIAKRMEVGAVIGAVPRQNVLREEPVPGDVILLVGGKTGRDGIGGATGSSKEHTEDSIHTAGAEVQKGNAPEERKLQRLYRNPNAATLIKKSNDFGAGGVSVAIGELADGLEIFLDRVPKKYEGLDGTELALSESQERMAVVVAPENIDRFKRLAREENLEAVEVAHVTADHRLKMYWRGTTIVDISRSFIDTNGVRQETDIKVTAPIAETDVFRQLPETVGRALENTSAKNSTEQSTGDSHIKEAWLYNLKDLNTCGQRGLSERFDSTVGAFTLTMPFGGAYQYTPTEAMAAKIPVLNGETTTASLMSYGFNPLISTWSPFHGAVYSVVEAVTKIVAAGGDYRKVRTSLQEYFEKLGSDSTRWGKPFSALLGAYHTLTELGIAAIGGKDSMSGTFKDLDVPPTLITFAVDTTDTRCITSPEFKKCGSTVIYLPLKRDQHGMPLFDQMKSICQRVTDLIRSNKIRAARTVRTGGIASALSEMSFGNKIGFQLTANLQPVSLFYTEYGSFLLELDPAEDIAALFDGIQYLVLGKTLPEPFIQFYNHSLPVEDALTAWESTLEPVFPTRVPNPGPKPDTIHYSQRNSNRPAVKIAKPRVIIPVSPGTNCEYETRQAFYTAGAEAETLVIRNLTSADIEESLELLTKKINNSQIIMIPGGFSAGDEPEGSGKFIAAIFRNPHVKEAVMNLLHQRDGLMLGICNGFQALVKLGLVPYGEIRDIVENSPTVTFNQIGRHMSRLSRTKIVSVLSPWFIKHDPGDMHYIPTSHGEGRFVAVPDMMQQLIRNGQVATQYVDMENNPTMDNAFNPNGSLNAIEGITSPDGRVLGKMTHTERINNNLALNIPGNKHQLLLESGVSYFG